MIKSNKEVTLKTQETCFLYRKPQKLKILKIFKKLFSKNLLKTFFFLGKSHSAEKTKSDQLSEIINWGFPLKWGTMNQSFLFFELIGVFIVHWLILEPQTYIVVEQFGAENIPLFSGVL